MFYEFARPTRPRFSPPESSAAQRHGSANLCSAAHGRRDYPGSWRCSLTSEHRGAHVAIYMPGSVESDDHNRVCAVWDEDRAGDAHGPAAVAEYIQRVPGQSDPDALRPGDFVSGSPGERCTAPNAQSWACTRERGHSGEHIASEGEFTLAIWGAPLAPREDAPEATTQARPPLTRGRVVRAVRMYPGYSGDHTAQNSQGHLGIAMQERPDDDGDVKVAFLAPSVPLAGVTADQAERDSDRSSNIWYVREWETLTDEEVAAYDADLSKPVAARESATAEERLAALWEALGKEANERGWCSEYDQFAARHGGPERPVEWNVHVRLSVRVPREHVRDGYAGSGLYAVTYEVTVRVTGATEQVARERTPAALLAAGWKGDLEAFTSVTRREF